MKNNLIAIVGMCGSGKSVATEFFKEKGYYNIYFGDVTFKELKKQGIDVTPENEKKMRESLRAKYGMGAYAVALLDDIKKALKNGNVVLESVYSWSEVVILKKEFEDLKIISIVTDRKKRYERLKNRGIRPFTEEEANIRDLSEIENLEKGGPIAYADYYVSNNEDLETYKEQLEIVYNQIEKRI